MKHFIDQFEQAFYYSPIGMVILTFDGQVLKVNPALSSLTGYTEKELLTSVTFRDITHPDDLDEDNKHMQKLLEGKKEYYEMEKRFFHKDGSLKWALISVSIVQEGNQPEYIITQVQDITERKQLELELVEGEKRYRNLITNLPDPIVVHDGNEITYASPSAATMVGVPIEEIVGKSISDIVDPKQYDLAKEYIEGIFQSNEPLHNFELRIGISEREYRDGIFSAIPINYMGKKSIMVSYRDITERKKVEMALKESEERYRRLIEFSPLGIAVHQDKIITYINDTALRLLGAKDESDVIGSHINQFIHPDFQEAVSNDINILETGEFVPTTTEKFIRFDGKIIDVEVNGIPIQINGESAVQVVFWDVTEKKKEADLVRYRAYHDTLTDLPNRLKFQMDLEEALENDTMLTILFLDLHGLKPVNDTYGHQAGDVLLVKVTSRLSEVIDTKGLVYRIGGDEFAVLIRGEKKEVEIIDIINKMDESLNQPIYISNTVVEVSASIGVVYYPDHGGDMESLLRHADMAMYHAKKTNMLYRIYER
ncbi:MAG TPA: PAS domain S-box protein [Ureibacillus sp.]|nr:PAS domain S-box protein [Ureibacillus sp.]